MANSPWPVYDPAMDIPTNPAHPPSDLLPSDIGRNTDLMRGRTRLSLALAGLVLIAASLLGQASAKDAPKPECLYERPETDHGIRLCIRRNHFDRDLCEIIDHFALVHQLPADFFARLIWRESLFRADAVSPKGAEGIAQFMPGTARLRGLENSFDVIAALSASSLYLSDLRHRFGNFGLAAAAYNAGETRLATFLAKGGLPLETRDYVFAITGHTVETWKDDPPVIAAPKLDPGKSFLDGCIALAQDRTLTEPILLESADWAPWGVQLAASFNAAVVGRSLNRAIARLPAPYNAERAIILRRRGAFGRRPRYIARIGRETRAEANRLCAVIRNNGGACIVLKN
jgi:soluble lytic murein transglycosylase-like protein